MSWRDPFQFAALILPNAARAVPAYNAMHILELAAIYSADGSPVAYAFLSLQKRTERHDGGRPANILRSLGNDRLRGSAIDPVFQLISSLASSVKTHPNAESQPSIAMLAAVR
jgi:hypothetical protein